MSKVSTAELRANKSFIQPTERFMSVVVLVRSATQRMECPATTAGRNRDLNIQLHGTTHTARFDRGHTLSSLAIIYWPLYRLNEMRNCCRLVSFVSMHNLWFGKWRIHFCQHLWRKIREIHAAVRVRRATRALLIIYWIVSQYSFTFAWVSPNLI